MYKTYKICEIGEVVGGGTPSTTNEKYWNGDIPWITPKDLTGYSSIYISQGEKFITKLGLKFSSKLLPKDTVLFTSRAPIGYIAIAKNQISTNQGFKSIICDKTKCVPLFLYYYLRANIEYIKLFGNGATFAEISASVMKKIKITLPKLEFQNKIASVLSAYDDLIEVNNKKIKALNEMAQEIYKEWFVRFRFPGHEKVEFQNGIPKDWEIIKMKDIFSDFIGGGWGNDDKDNAFNTPAFVIRGTDFKNVENGILDSCPYRWHKTSNFKSRQLKENDFILEISGGTAEQPVGRAIIIEKEILDRFNNKVICASFCKLIRINEEKITPYYFYYWLKYLYDTKIIERFQLQSTGIINFKFDYFTRQGIVLLPKKEILDNFEKIIKPIRKNIQKLGYQNENLKTQRDLLLPRLMSGKLEVKG